MPGFSSRLTVLKKYLSITAPMTSIVDFEKDSLNQPPTGTGKDRRGRQNRMRVTGKPVFYFALLSERIF